MSWEVTGVGEIRDGATVNFVVVRVRQESRDSVPSEKLVLRAGEGLTYQVEYNRE